VPCLCWPCSGLRGLFIRAGLALICVKCLVVAEPDGGVSVYRSHQQKIAAISGGLTQSMIYLALKHLHLICVAVSGSGFALRGFWMLTGSPLLERRWVRIVPHVVDTVLLASAIALAVLTPSIHLFKAG